MSRQWKQMTDWPEGSGDAPSQDGVGAASVAGRGRRIKPVGKRVTKAAPLRVALLDGDPALPATLRSYLAIHEPDWELDWHVHGEPAWRKLRAAPPQLILLERTLPDGCGLEWLRRCQRQWPEIPVVILTTQGCGKTLWDAMVAGARGYWVKDGNAASLVKQLREAPAGKPILCDQAARLLLEAFAMRRQRTENQWGLTRREEEIMQRICDCKTEKDIAGALGIETGTVHVHLMKIYKKLAVHDRAAAIRNYLAAMRGGG